MNITNYLKKISLLTLILFAAVFLSVAQTTKSAAPRQEKLLNNLKLLIWSEPAAAKVSVKLRVHSGAAFDTLNKEGTMAMLADILFPNESVKEFFSEELGGSLSVESNYDFIQINATGNPEQILTILETLATAVTKPTIDPETAAKVRVVRLEKIKELEKNPAYVADLAVANRLFGAYPYGRSAEGTAESLIKLDFADILLAKQRFLTADNATLAVSGNVKPDYVFKAVRQLFGGWEKADKKVPATFAQPNAPDSSLQIINVSETIPTSEIRFAFRGLPRNSKDFIASKILVEVMNNRLQKEFAKERPNAIFIIQNSNLLPGLIMVRLSNLITDAEAVEEQLGEKPPITHLLSVKQENLAQGLLTQKTLPEEFQKAKTTILEQLNQKNRVDYWLDVDTYKLVSVKEEMQKINEVTLADAQRIADNFLKQSFVKIWLSRLMKKN